MNFGHFGGKQNYCVPEDLSEEAVHLFIVKPPGTKQQGKTKSRWVVVFKIEKRKFEDLKELFS
jgi:hypothetical protein